VLPSTCREHVGIDAARFHLALLCVDQFGDLEQPASRVQRQRHHVAGAKVQAIAAERELRGVAAGPQILQHDLGAPRRRLGRANHRDIGPQHAVCAGGDNPRSPR
jgi:hypothetical protein